MKHKHAALVEALTGRFEDHHAEHLSRLDTGRKVRSHVRQLEALGFNVTLSQTA
ncbi:hypothetical protein IL992_05975 [Microbispora sp. NEAU-D428]|uniref:hypothetical protein n=1 Tax=Microbispora sitophila TaxID=2771537 RepID=UPI001865C86E|nr:hypothetical protein [Microbispora sitophila]MBE3008737.1 hypothetical protein [Microbispora sitophila]